jgi:hypothetical protein
VKSSTYTPSSPPTLGRFTPPTGIRAKAVPVTVGTSHLPRPAPPPQEPWHEPKHPTSVKTLDGKG